MLELYRGAGVGTVSHKPCIKVIVLRITLLSAVLSLVASLGTAAPVSTFDDGFDGWQKFVETDPNFDLLLDDFDTFADFEHQDIGGNPAGYVRVSDFAGGGGMLPIQAPAEFTGDLSGFTGIRFDQYQFFDATSGGLSLQVIGSDGSRYSKSTDLPSTTENWESATISFSELVPVEGSASLDAVLADVRYLLIGMDMTTNVGGLESGIDNITLTVAQVPLPAAAGLMLFGIAGIAAVGCRRRKLLRA